MKSYDPKNWYWVFRDEPGAIFSSAIGRNIASSDDSNFVAWSADGSKPTVIANRAELGEVLADARVRPADPDVLDAYKGEHAKQMTDEIQTKALLWAINEIRILKGQPALTKGADIRSFLKELM